MSKLTTKEMMAIAVLQGDDTAAYALADMLQENRKEGLEIIKPLREVVDLRNIRVAIFYKDGVIPTSEDMVYTDNNFRWWIEGKIQVSHLAGIDRIEVYSIPIIEQEEELPPIHFPPRHRS